MNTVHLFSAPAGGANNMTGSVLSGAYTPAAAIDGPLIELGRNKSLAFHFTVTGSASGSLTFYRGIFSASLVQYPQATAATLNLSCSNGPFVVEVSYTGCPYASVRYTHLTGAGVLVGSACIKP